MVKSFLIFFVLATALNAYASGCTKGSEYEPSLCPLKIPKISSITILENAAKSPLEKDDSITCADFSIKEADVRRYLSKAKVTNDQDAHEKLDWSPCYASGKVTFKDGQTGEWYFNQLRSGSLVFYSGKKLTLYCPKCTFKPFVE